MRLTYLIPVFCTIFSQVLVSGENSLENKTIDRISLGRTLEYEISYVPPKENVMAIRKMLLETVNVDKKETGEIFVERRGLVYEGRTTHTLTQSSLTFDMRLLLSERGILDVSHKGEDVHLLKAPYKPGAKWIDESKDKKSITRIVAIEKVKVKAGEFNDCLKMESLIVDRKNKTFRIKTDSFSLEIGAVKTIAKTYSLSEIDSELYQDNFEAYTDMLKEKLSSATSSQIMFTLVRIVP